MSGSATSKESTQEEEQLEEGLGGRDSNKATKRVAVIGPSSLFMEILRIAERSAGPPAKFSRKKESRQLTAR